jgi:hypothetical protein
MTSPGDLTAAQRNVRAYLEAEYTALQPELLDRIMEHPVTRDIMRCAQATNSPASYAGDRIADTFATDGEDPWALPS